MTARRPKAVIAHLSGVQLFTEDDLERIAEVATILDPEPISSWGDARSAELLATAEVIIGHWGCPRLDGTVLEQAPVLGLFAYAAGSVKGVVTDALFERGIRVTSGSSANAEPVAEFTLAAILFAGKDVFWQRDLLHDPRIASQRQPGDVPIGNWGKTIGIVGASQVGRRLIALLRPFPHLSVALYDPFVSSEEATDLGVVKLELDALCSTVDILSVHAPELPSTRHMIGASQLGLLRTGAAIINTARGALIDHDALIAELESGRLYAMLDVTEPEPLAAKSVLRRLPNVYLTPHLAGSQGTELARMTAYLVDEITRWTGSMPAHNEVLRTHLDRLA
jgi:phosphoglycerate dehydrogenase-like enzyme